MDFIDLHVHSNASDGTLTPTEIVNLAKEKGLTAIALTDHDTMQGVSEASKAARGSNLEIIQGVEISCEYKKKEIHILGLFLDRDCEELLSKLAYYREKRDERNKKMISNFQKAGIPMTMEELSQGDSNAVITRAHFARYLVEHGYVRKKDEAFKKYLGKKCSFYETREYIKPQMAIELIKKARGLSFLAHAYLYKMSDKEIEQMVEELVSYGLDGLEVYHSSHNICESRKLLALAKKKKLLVSGGSDFHGANKPDIDLSVGRGNLRLPHYILEDMKKSEKFLETAAFLHMK